MEKIEDLAKQASQLTMYDLKSYYNQAKNMVLNVSEMEAKVREATNDDAWGASSTLMQEIAQGTHSFQQFNEIMPTIYSRFMEKEAREWRQIYKSLTLLEYLVKNGSERVVDDARSHISTVKMLRSFHYIDVQGKDQGINVRNRAKELSDLLADVERIRQERRKAKANRNKYQGQGGGAAAGEGGFGGGGGATFQSATGSRYGGFGSDSMGGGGGGGGFDNGADLYRNQASHHRSASGAAAGGFDEYDAGDDEDSHAHAAPPARQSSSQSAGRRTQTQTQTVNRGKQKEEEPKPKPKVVDLFSFDEDEQAVVGNGAPPGGASLVDDDFDDFQAAPTPVPVSKPATTNLFDMLDAPSTAKPSVPAMSMGNFTSPPAYGMNSFAAPTASVPQPQQQQARPNYTSTPSTSSAPAAKPQPKAAGGFDDLFSSALSSFGAAPVQQPQGGKSIKELEREKLNASLWGSAGTVGNGSSQAQQSGQKGAVKPTMDFGDLLG